MVTYFLQDLVGIFLQDQAEIYFPLPSPPLPHYIEEFEELQGQPNILRGTSPPPFFANNAPNFHIRAHRVFIESLQQTNHQHQTTYLDLKQLP